MSFGITALTARWVRPAPSSEPVVGAGQADFVGAFRESGLLPIVLPRLVAGRSFAYVDAAR